jgi:hypothetical protein
MTDETRRESDALEDLPEATSDAVSPAEQANVKGGQSSAAAEVTKPAPVDAAVTPERLDPLGKVGSFI